MVEVEDNVSNRRLAIKYHLHLQPNDQTMALTSSPSSIDPLHNERLALSLLQQQPHILDIYDSSMSVHIHGHTYFAVAMELAGQGDMLEYVQTRAFSETLARTYFRQLVSALRTAHMAGIYHRDVKLENLLLANDFGLKLADFGLCYMIPSYTNERNEEPFISGVCGSPGYVAPEVCSQVHYLGSTADVWSAGCVLFAMLAGHSAFEMTVDPNHTGNSSHQDEWLAMILRGDYSSFWRCHFSGGLHLSPQVVDLLNKMFTADPFKRLSLDEILSHPWMTSGHELGPIDLFTEMDARRCDFEISHVDLPTRLSMDEQDEKNGPIVIIDHDVEKSFHCTLAEALEPFVNDDDDLYESSSSTLDSPDVSFMSIVVAHHGASDMMQTTFNETQPNVVTPRDDDKTIVRLTTPSPRTFLPEQLLSPLFSETSSRPAVVNASVPHLMLNISDASAFTPLPFPSSPRPMVSPRPMELSPEPCASPISIMCASQFSGKAFMDSRNVHKTGIESLPFEVMTTSNNKRGSYSSHHELGPSFSMEILRDNLVYEPPTKRRMSDVSDETSSYYFTSS